MRNILCVSPDFLSIGKIFIKKFSKEFSNVDKEQFDFEAVNYINKSVAGKEKWIGIES